MISSQRTIRILSFWAILLGIVFIVSLFIESEPQIVMNEPSDESGSFLMEDSLQATTSINKDLITKDIQQISKNETVKIPARFEDSFSQNRVVEEASAISKSTDSDWWVNSGGRLIASNSTAKTIQGSLSSSDVWYKRYITSNTLDTDAGTHPQNIFRLVHTTKWENFAQQVYFKINKVHLSESPNRNASNGVLLFNRYQTGDDLYYTGLRVDGAVVIKKKINGNYYTLATKQIIPNKKYDRESNPNVLPLNEWIGIKSEVVTNSDSSVTIKLYIDIGRTGTWKFVLDAKDRQGSYGGDPLLEAGFAGIRTDFMDVEFDEYSIVSQ